MKQGQSEQVRRWRGKAWRRRLVLAVAVLVPAVLAAQAMGQVLPPWGGRWLQVVMVVVFGLLFCWISFGFWTALVGFWSLITDRRPLPLAPPAKNLSSDAKTAVIMPICNEDVVRVFAGLRATCLSVRHSGMGALCDFFILSDTTQAGVWVEEERAWARLRRELGEMPRLFYRKRRVNTKKKSGNVADFCRRFGKGYRYMVVLDADSIMQGATLQHMVALMESNPQAGIMQTAPAAVNKDTLLARLQQFSNRVYGPIFTRGLASWLLGDGNYWGHNAIIRIAPFMEYCALPRLKGRGPFAGDILSHDFVEAALMRRAGYEVWLLPDLPGSYEETPPTIVDELKRDRRWCQGNLQHLRIMGAHGIHPVHRTLFVNGVMSYGAALFWVFFLVLGFMALLVEQFAEPVYFPSGGSHLFPKWPIYHPEWALSLFTLSLFMLLFPKVLGVAVAGVQHWRTTHNRHDILMLVGGALLETLLSVLLAPIRMYFHSKFVLMGLLGLKTAWGGQRRDDNALTWAEAVRFFGVATILAFFLAGAAYHLDPFYFWWLLPTLAGLMLSIPVAVWTSSAEMGRWLRSLGFLVIKEEVDPPQELVALHSYQARLLHDQAQLPELWRRDGFVACMTDPHANMLHAALLRKLPSDDPRAVQRFVALRHKALDRGPNNLNAREKMTLLKDPVSVKALHLAIWALPDEKAVSWGRPIVPAAVASLRTKDEGDAGPGRPEDQGVQHTGQGHAAVVVRGS